MPLIQHAVAKVLHSVRKWVEVSSGRGSHHGHSMGGYGWPSTRSCHQSSKASCGYASPARDASHSHGNGDVGADDHDEDDAKDVDGDGADESTEKQDRET